MADEAEIRESLRTKGILALTALIVFGCLVWGWKHRGGSVDMALHYALVEFIREHWVWPTLRDTHMGEMNQYPPVSHTIAAIVGLLTGSSFLGLHLVSTASAIVVLAILFVLLRFRSAGATLSATTALAIILLVFQYSHVFLGREITGNFFYPQLFGEMCVFSLVLLRSRLSLGVAAEIGSAIGATFLLGWVYPIAAVQLAGIAIVWRALLLSKAWYESRRLGGGELLSFAILFIGLLAAILFHPLFPVVTNLAINEGDVGVRVPRALVIPATFLLCALTVVLGFEFARRRLTLRAPDAFVALCGGVACASLAQEAAFYLLGIGSRYGVYKHIFPVSTLLVAALIVCFIHFRRLDAIAKTGHRKAQLARFAFVPATLIALAAGNVPWRGERLAPILRAEAYLRSTMMARTDPVIEAHAVLLGGGYIERFGFSMGILHLPKEIALALIYENRSTPEEREAIVARTPITYAFVSSSAVRDPACAVGADEAARLTMVLYACHQSSLQSK